MPLGPFGGVSSVAAEPEYVRVEPGQGLSRTAPGRLQGMDEDSDEETSNLFKVVP